MRPVLLRSLGAALIGLALALPGAALSAEHGTANGPFYLRLPRITVPVIEEGGVTRHWTITLTVELADAPAFDRAEALAPRLTDAFVRVLHAMASRAGGADSPDVAVAKRHLMAAGARILGPEALRDVLVYRIGSRRVD
ncbi:MAG TPA: hypothetical protein VF342_11940 [Alphaproteobacteria bacterium]